MSYERNVIPDFDYIMVDAHVSTNWDKIPKSTPESLPKIWTQKEMEDKCGPSLTLPLLKFEKPPVVLCLRQDEVTKDDFAEVRIYLEILH